jgi:hypothetical protein
LAKEFNITKPTISDAIRVLDKKGIIKKDFSSVDNRRYSIRLTKSGNKIVAETANFADPLKARLTGIEPANLESLFDSLGKLIYQLNQNGILTVQRTCYGCKFYKKTETTDFCNMLKKPMLNSDIRLDCPDFEENSTN